MESSFALILAHGGLGVIAVYGIILVSLVGGIWKFLSWVIGTPPASKTSGLVALVTVASIEQADLIRGQLEARGISACVPEADQIHISPYSRAFTVYVAAGELDSAKAALKGLTNA